MGNIFIAFKKKDPPAFEVRSTANKDLYKSLINTNIDEKIIYLENKIDELDNKLWTLDNNVIANMTVMSADIHSLYKKINTLP